MFLHKIDVSTHPIHHSHLRYSAHRQHSIYQSLWGWYGESLSVACSDPLQIYWLSHQLKLNFYPSILKALLCMLNYKAVKDSMMCVYFCTKGYIILIILRVILLWNYSIYPEQKIRQYDAEWTLKIIFFKKSLYCQNTNPQILDKSAFTNNLLGSFHFRWLRTIKNLQVGLGLPVNFATWVKHPVKMNYMSIMCCAADIFFCGVFLKC